MKTEILNQEAVAAWLPDRDPWGHKGDFGKLLLLCGSVGYTGAAALAARAAVRSGAGLVLLGVPEPVYTIEAVKLDEPVVFPLAAEGDGLSPAAVPEILRRLAGCDACLVGPGLGRLPGVRAVTEAVLREARCPVVLDADGLNVLEGAADALKARRAPTVLTPHDGEFRRLGGAVGPDRMASAAALAQTLGAVVLLKGHRTVVTEPGDMRIAPATPAWPPAAAAMCWQGSWFPSWARACPRWRPLPAPPGSMGRRGTCAPVPGASMALPPRIWWRPCPGF